MAFLPDRATGFVYLHLGQFRLASPPFQEVGGNLRKPEEEPCERGATLRVKLYPVNPTRDHTRHLLLCAGADSVSPGGLASGARGF